MASTSTLNEQNLHQDNTTNDSNPKPTDSVTNSATMIDSGDTEGLETENTDTAVSAASFDTNCGGNDPSEKGKEVMRCAGKGKKGVSWGYAMEQGGRSTMEDSVGIYSSFMSLTCSDFGGCSGPGCKYANEIAPVHFFGVFDGHGGPEVSSHCANGLHEMVAAEWGREGSGDGWSRRWEVSLCRAYERTDDALKDMELGLHSVGSTTVVVILSPCQIIAANCGDSRAVLCRGKQAFPLTVDHKLDRNDELARITNGGGRILNGGGCSRVEGVLCMTRAIGDHDLKQWVISVPEVTFTTRTEEDECLILASDGLWDVMSNEDVVKFARKELRLLRKLTATEYTSAPPAWYVSRQLLKKAFDAGSSDNISIIVVDLKSPRRRHQQQL